MTTVDVSPQAASNLWANNIFKALTKTPCFIQGVLSGTAHFGRIKYAQLL